MFVCMCIYTSLCIHCHNVYIVRYRYSVTKIHILDHNPVRARVFDPVFSAFSNDAWTSKRRVTSHFLPLGQVSTKTVIRSHVVAPSQLHPQMENCTLTFHAFRIVEGFLPRGGDMQPWAKRHAPVASRPFDVEINLLDVHRGFQRRPMGLIQLARVPKLDPSGAQQTPSLPAPLSPSLSPSPSPSLNLSLPSPASSLSKRRFISSAQGTRKINK
jgi:hypothetical protein